jgi:hypothetical protein
MEETKGLIGWESIRDEFWHAKVGDYDLHVEESADGVIWWSLKCKGAIVSVAKEPADSIDDAKRIAVEAMWRHWAAQLMRA